ncbi:MAG: hypothetical protein JWM95_1014 [Gemmatimonadetes bacterium]|nr:hypothetical protein [Gemmatimonadota bacterium]
MTVLACGMTILFAAGIGAQEVGGKGTIYVGTYAKKILVIDEATMKTVDSIPTSIGIPYNMSLSYNRSHIYANDPADEKVEVFDLATRKAINSFSLSRDSLKVQIVSMNVDPKERFAVLLIRTTRRRPDRYEIGKPTLVKFDLAKKVVTDTIPWPLGQERENAQIIFSPSGDLMYFFTQDDILIYSAETLKQVDKWDLGRSWDEGLGRFNFGFPNDVFEEPGFYTGLFRTTDPVNRRAMMGIARVDLVKKSVEFFTLGPTDNVSMRLAPGRKRAYGLKSQTGLSEFWTFDLDSHRVLGKTEFKGRPRMGMAVSSNGKIIYIHTAGTTIDLYDTQTFKLTRTVDLHADQTRFLLVPPPAAR